MASTLAEDVPHRGGSRVRRSAWVSGAIATGIVLVLLFLLPGVVRAADSTMTRYDQTDERIEYVGTWDTFEKTAAYMTAYARADTRGDSATIYFDGTRLDWVAMMGTSTGKADVYLDGVFKRTVDLYASSARYKVVVWSTGDIPSGLHKLTISRSPSCPTGKFITLDAVDVAGTLMYGPPAVTGLSPVSGSTAGGAPVVISGSNFHEASAVTFGDDDAVSFTVESGTMITAVAPPHEAGTVRVKVITPSGPSPDTAADDYLYAEVTVPTITGVTPSSGAPGTSVVITGTGFIGLTGPDAVTFGGVDAAGYTVDSPTQITAVAPSRDAAIVQVKVDAAGGATADTPADDFTYFTRYDQKDSRLSYTGAWEAFAKTAAWKGSYGRTKSSGGSVTLTFIGTRLTWIAMKGTTTGRGDVYLDGVFQKTVDLAAPAASYQQDVWSTGDLSDAVHTVRIVRNSGSPSGTYLTIDAVDVVGTLLGGGRIEQADSRLAYAGTWSAVSASKGSGGSYGRASGSGASAYVDFTGVRLTWIATTGPGMGKAWVSLDGGTAQSVDLSAATTAYQQKVWDTGPLALGDHEVRIWWDQSNASGKYITADAFDVLGSLRQAYRWRRYEQTDLRLLCTGSWSTVTASGTSGGSYKRTSSPSAFFDLLFTGRGFDWIATTGPGMGKAEVSIDGGAPVTVDLFSDTTLNKQTVWSSPTLPDGLHRVQITVSPASAPGAFINVDAIDVHGSLPGVGSTSAAKNMWAEKRLQELSYLPGAINGTFDYKTRGAVIAFQKWEGLSRDGVLGTTVWTRLHTATRPQPTRIGTTDPWIEVDKTKQVLLFCKKGAVLYTVPVSTGSASVGFITPSGTFSIISKTPPRGSLYYPMAITSGIAIHGYTTVPTQPASHGCIRTQYWDQDVLYPRTPMGTRVYTYDSAGKSPGSSARVDQTNGHIVKTGAWTDFTNASAYKGSYGRSSTSDATATVWFTGTKIAWIGMKGSTPGIVDVYLDDEYQTTLDLYASPARYQVTLWTSDTLPDGIHHLDLKRNSSSRSTEYIVLDAVDIWGTIMAPPLTSTSAVSAPFTRYEETDSNIIKSGSWYDFAKPGLASGGSYGRSSTPGASAIVYFEGTRLDWIAMTGSTPGKVDVYLDDEYQTTIDLESSSARYDVAVWSTGDIADGSHKVELKRSDDSLADEYITLDAVDIWGAIGSGP